MRRNAHVRFGGRAEETTGWKHPHGASARPYTQHPTGEGWLYLACVLDVCSRRIVGWSMAEHADTNLVVNAVQMAMTARDPRVGLVHHSDQGAQYTSLAFGRELQDLGLVGSMGRTGTAHDNAAMESFFASLQTELLD